MRPAGPTFWHLDADVGWRGARAEHVAAGATLRLAAAASGPLALDSPEGSLGGLVLPRGMALDSTGRCHLLDAREPGRVRRLDPGTRRFRDLPGLGGSGGAARQFRRPTAIAVAGTNLYVVDRGNRRVQVVGIDGLELRAIWGPWDRDGRPVAEDDERAWEPVDAAAGRQAGHVHLLDRRYSRVWRHQAGTARLELVVDDPDVAGRWSRVAVDAGGRLYLLRGGDRPVLDVYDRHGRRLGTVTDPGAVRDRFPAPPVRASSRGTFRLPEELLRPCGRRLPDPPGDPEVPLPWDGDGGEVFDRYGDPAAFTRDDRPGPARYAVAGTWESGPLDSLLHRCEWHRVEVDLAALPDGGRVEVQTTTSNLAGGDAGDRPPPPARWETAVVAVGEERRPGTGWQPRTVDGLVRSPQGRRLWLRLRLRGDGFTSPGVSAIRVHYPRASYADELPAVYLADDRSRSFLARYLSLFQVEWDRLERRVDELAGYLDPKTVPAGPWLDHLASWLGIAFEPSWNDGQRRALLVAAPRVVPRRGTAEALRTWLRVALAGRAGGAASPAGPYPLLVEGFRERARLMLAGSAGLPIGGVPVWSSAVVDRLQLGVSATLGRSRVVSTGDPPRDLFHEHAHRFAVVLPACWVPDADAEHRLRSVVLAQKPAHTAFDLCLVEPRLRVGVQSTVGLDTVVGVVPRARLACRNGAAPAPSSPPRSRLGYDTVLACRAAATPPAVGRVRVGTGTTLA